MERFKEEVKRWWLLFEAIVFVVTGVLVSIGGILLLREVSSSLNKAGWEGNMTSVLVMLAIFYWTIKAILAGMGKMREYLKAVRSLRITWGKGN